MRCECCDAELSDSEISAKFVEKDGSKPTRFVNMCTECRGFLPPDIGIVSRPPTRKQKDDEPLFDPFDLREFDDDEAW